MSATLASRLTRSLRDELLRGAFEPGQPLRLNQLSERFGVSLSPLREALSRLAAEGFVIAHDQRGYQVAPVSVEDFREITQLRVLLESLALRKSIEQGDDAWEAALLAAHHRLQLLERRHAAGQAASLDDWEARHREFHLALISACRMPILQQFCENLLDFSDRYRRIFLRSRPLDRDIPQEHGDVLEATLARDADRACALLTRHLERTAANVSAALARDGAALDGATVEGTSPGDTALHEADPSQGAAPSGATSDAASPGATASSGASAMPAVLAAEP